MQAALIHGGKEPDGFQCHGLAARVGPSDHQRIKIISEVQINRHRLCRIQKRMPRTMQIDSPLRKLRR